MLHLRNAALRKSPLDPSVGRLDSDLPLPTRWNPGGQRAGRWIDRRRQRAWVLREQRRRTRQGVEPGTVRTGREGCPKIGEPPMEFVMSSRSSRFLGFTPRTGIGISPTTLARVAVRGSARPSRETAASAAFGSGNAPCTHVALAWPESFASRIPQMDWRTAITARVSTALTQNTRVTDAFCRSRSSVTGGVRPTPAEARLCALNLEGPRPRTRVRDGSARVALVVSLSGARRTTPRSARIHRCRPNRETRWHSIRPR